MSSLRQMFPKLLGYTGDDAVPQQQAPGVQLPPVPYHQNQAITQAALAMLSPNPMTGRPDFSGVGRGMAANQQRQMQMYQLQQAEAARLQAENNRLLEQERRQQAIDAINTNPYMEPHDKAFFSVYPKNYDPQDFQPVDAVGVDYKGETDLRGKFDTLSKPFREVNDAYARIRASASPASPAGDLSMIFNYMKMLDPGSTVREGEFATAARAKPLLEQLGINWDAVSNLWEGKQLTATQRQDFVDRAERLYDAQLKDYEMRAAEYRTLAEQYDFDPYRVVPDRQYRERAGVPARINNDAEWEALPPGTPYIAPDGSVRKK